MSLRLVIDMNLSPTWAAYLEAAGWEAVHWSTVGDPRAPDREIMDRAIAFGTALALTYATGPSVFQVRGRDVLPDHLGRIVVDALRAHGAALESGALVVVDEWRSRVRVLPL